MSKKDFKNPHEITSKTVSPELLGGRLPPQALDAEKAVLGAMLQNNASIDAAISDIKLVPKDFYQDKHSFVYEAIISLFDDNRPIDVITVGEELQKNKKAWGLIQDQQFLWDLTTEVSSGAHVPYHATIVKSKSLLRELIATCSNITNRSFDPSIEPKETLAYAEQQLYAISDDNTKGDLEHVKTVMARTMEMIGQYSSGGVTGTPTGFTDLDTLTSGLKPGELIVLAGRPAMGKTAFALSLLGNCTIDARKSVVFFSLEMPGEQLMQRVLCTRSEVDMSALRQGRLPQAEMNKVIMNAGPISEASIFIDDTASLSLSDLKSKSRALKKRQGLDLIIIDYLQLMDGPGESRQVQISTISRGLKELAKELKCPVIALSQLSRKVEERQGDGKPMISDLRESGAIEQDADMVWFVYRKIMYDKNADPTGAELIVAKHRNGPTADINLTFQGKFAGFFNFSHRSDEPVDSSFSY